MRWRPRRSRKRSPGRDRFEDRIRLQRHPRAEATASPRSAPRPRRWATTASASGIRRRSSASRGRRSPRSRGTRSGSGSAPWVTNPLSRHPVVTAACAATVDDLAPGRLVHRDRRGRHRRLASRAAHRASSPNWRPTSSPSAALLEDGSAEWNGTRLTPALGRATADPDHHRRPRAAVAAARGPDRRRRRDRARGHAGGRPRRRSSCSPGRAEAGRSPTTSRCGSPASGGSTRAGEGEGRRRLVGDRVRAALRPTRASRTSSSPRSIKTPCSSSAGPTTWQPRRIRAPSRRPSTSSSPSGSASAAYLRSRFVFAGTPDEVEAQIRAAMEAGAPNFDGAIDADLPEHESRISTMGEVVLPRYRTTGRRARDRPAVRGRPRRHAVRGGRARDRDRRREDRLRRTAGRGRGRGGRTIDAPASSCSPAGSSRTRTSTSRCTRAGRRARRNGCNPRKARLVPRSSAGRRPSSRSPSWTSTSSSRSSTRTSRSTPQQIFGGRCLHRLRLPSGADRHSVGRGDRLDRRRRRRRDGHHQVLHHRPDHDPGRDPARQRLGARALLARMRTSSGAMAMVHAEDDDLIKYMEAKLPGRA